MMQARGISKNPDTEYRAMDGDKDRLGLGAGLLATGAIGLCCGAPLLILAGGAIVAALGWTYLGIGAGTVLLAIAAVVAVYRYRRAVTRECMTPPRQSDSVQRKV
jgi:membrane protein implicated in regulation of membrane protease activity